jgi:predicted enzyme related to lactoylglutathione lyase
MPERSSYAPGTPSWADLSTTDPDAARDFYGALLGWEYAIDPSEQTGHYATASMAGKRVAGVNGMTITEQPPAWTTYFATDDAQRLAELVTENGGAVAMGPMQIGPAGSMVIWQDPGGAFAGAWQAGDMTGAQVVNQPGAITWNELNTRDLAASVAFYSAILPVHAQDMSEGDFHYQTLQVGGVDVAGMWQMTADVAPDVPPYWGVYFAVADTDASVSQAGELGATVSMPAKDSPYGRLAGLVDPQGATFYVIQAPANQ